MEKTDPTVSIEIIGTIVGGIIIQFRTKFKMPAGFFNHGIINGKKNRLVHGKYHVRGKEGIERLVNLISLYYSAMTLLPYSDETFFGYQSASTQETRYEIGRQIQTNIILCSFGKCLKTIKNCSILIKVVKDYILSGIRKFQKL